MLLNPHNQASKCNLSITEDERYFLTLAWKVSLVIQNFSCWCNQSKCAHNLLLNLHLKSKQPEAFHYISKVHIGIVSRLHKPIVSLHSLYFGGNNSQTPVKADVMLSVLIWTHFLLFFSLGDVDPTKHSLI